MKKRVATNKPLKLTIQITDIKIEKISIPASKDPVDKAVFYCKTNNGNRDLSISRAWTVTHSGNRCVQGLWVVLDKNNNISPDTVVAQLLKKYKANALEDLKGLTTDVVLDENNTFYVFSTLNQDE